jgi:hypothetical protein
MTISISLEQPETFDAGGAAFRVLDDGSSTSGRVGVVEGQLAPAGPDRPSTSTGSTTRPSSSSPGSSASPAAPTP